MTNDSGIATGILTIERFDEANELVERCEVHNLITSAGDNVYIARGSGVASPPAAPTGFKLGTSNTNAPSKSGAGAALNSYLSGSNKAFDSGYPQVSGNVATYRRTYAAGEATSASPILEAVIVNDAISSDATSPAANTISRAPVSGISQKGALDSVIVTWTHTFTGA